MKKNVMMRIASVLLIAVLISTCGISGTYAKYVTNGTATDTARVAKWGVEVVADGTHTFGGYYKNQANGNTLNTSYTVGTDSVKSEGGKVVAPGTTGTAAGLTINGQPEVDTQVKFTAEITLANWLVDGGYYCPLVIYVNGTPYKGVEYASAAEFEAAVEAAIAAVISAPFKAGTAIDDNSLTVNWEWPFETGNDQAAKDHNNIKDTKLGNAATPATITIAITAIVEQVD